MPCTDMSCTGMSYTSITLRAGILYTITLCTIFLASLPVLRGAGGARSLPQKYPQVFNLLIVDCHMLLDVHDLPVLISEVE